MTRLLLVALLAAAVAGSACSLVLDFEEEGRPCGPDEDPRDGLGDCIEGYSCLVTECVENRSVPAGKTCRVHAHCEQGHVCTTLPFICRRACENPFGNRECGSNQACLAMTDAGDVAVGACGASDCSDSPCDGDDTVCVGIKPGVGHCMDGCQIDCTGADCAGNCGFGDDSEARACQPVGPDNTLACVAEGDRDHGRGCNLLDAFCDRAHACAMPPDAAFGVCVKYCDPTAASSCTGLDDPSRSPPAPATCNTISDRGFSICGTMPSGPDPDGGPQGDPGPGDPGPGDPAA